MVPLTIQFQIQSRIHRCWPGNQLVCARTPYTSYILSQLGIERMCVLHRGISCTSCFVELGSDLFGLDVYICL